MVLTVLINACVFAYVFGVTNQKLRNVDRDVERIRLDVETLRHDSRDTDNRIHDMALVLAKISTQLDQLASLPMLEHCDISACPFAKRETTARTNRKIAVDVERGK
jgi:hypothetical protein